jgi:hypothetical protein
MGRAEKVFSVGVDKRCLIGVNVFKNKKYTQKAKHPNDKSDPNPQH